MTTMTPEEKSKSEVLMMKIKSGAIDDNTRYGIISTLSLSLLLGRYGTMPQRKELAKAVQQQTKLWGADEVIDLLVQAWEKKVPLELALVTVIESFCKAEAAAITRIKAATAAFDAKHECQFEKETE
jgi:hypothetical protein